MRRNIFGWSMAALLVSAGAAGEVHRTAPGACFETVNGSDGPGGGIATPRLRPAVIVTYCDGRRFRVTSTGGVGLQAADERGSPAIPTDGLPDGEISRGGGAVAAAWLTGPSDDYGHAILGDGVEASGFRIVRRGGARLDYRLPTGSVFEDLRVRLADLDGDERDEAIVIRSHLDRGAALAVYRITETAIQPLAESAAIGLPHRWLNPAGAADFDGDGRIEIAHVETPHIGGIIRMFELRPDGLRLERSARGFSNHAIGSRVLDMSAVVDWNADKVPDLVLPDASRRHMMVVSFAGGDTAVLARIAHHADIATAVVATDLDRDGAADVVYGLADGTLVRLTP